MITVKGCPHCGFNSIVSRYKEYEKGRFYWVECKTCEARSKGVFISFDDLDKDWGNRADLTAVENWNMREENKESVEALKIAVNQIRQLRDEKIRLMKAIEDKDTEIESLKSDVIRYEAEEEKREMRQWDMDTARD